MVHEDEYNEQAAIEEIAEEWSEDPAKVKEAWDLLLEDGDALSKSGHDVAAALVGDPSTLNARAVRLLGYINQMVFQKLSEMAADEAPKRRKQALEDEGEARYWAKMDQEGGF